MYLVSLALLLALLRPLLAAQLRCGLDKRGFHRDLTCSWRLPDGCERRVELQLNVSASFFVDRFELRNRGLVFATNRSVNTEAPEWLAQPFLLTVTTTRSNLSLPVHLRYHLPSYIRYSAAFLPHPRLKFDCEGRSHVTDRRRPFDVECPVGPIDHVPAVLTLTVLTLGSALMIQYFSFFG